MSKFASLITFLTSPKLHRERNMTWERFQLWRQSIRARLPSSTDELVELHLDCWQEYNQIRLREDPEGDPSLPELSARGRRYLLLTDALRYELWSQMSHDQRFELQNKEDARLRMLVAATEEGHASLPDC